jgi:hypothetical protein
MVQFALHFLFYTPFLNAGILPNEELAKGAYMDDMPREPGVTIVDLDHNSVESMTPVPELPERLSRRLLWGIETYTKDWAPGTERLGKPIGDTLFDFYRPNGENSLDGALDRIDMSDAEEDKVSNFVCLNPLVHCIPWFVGWGTIH